MLSVPSRLASSATRAGACASSAIERARATANALAGVRTAMYVYPSHRPMSTKTQTTTTHYHIQKKRRAEFIEEWRKHRQSVIREEDVELVPTARGMRTGVYMGWDGDRPPRSLDALVHEVDPGTVTTIHRHSWDAILFMVS